jgi:hypothetical protein
MKELEINLKKKADTWVKAKPKTMGRMVRLTVDVPPDLHQKLKMKCVMERTTIADMVRGWIEEQCK